MKTVDIRAYTDAWGPDWAVPGPGTSRRIRRDIATRAAAYTGLAASQALVQAVYTEALQDDPAWHFLLEPEGVIIIRVSDASVPAVERCLATRQIACRVYPYPFPGLGLRDPEYYGEGPDTIIGQHNALFVPVFHAHSVAALQFTDEEFFAYLERVVHCACVPKWFFQATEDDVLAELAERRRTRGQD